MPVLVEAFSIIIKDSSIHQKFRGGRERFMSTIPNNTHCCDDDIHRVGFMSPEHVEAYIEFLEKNGLVYIEAHECIDIVAVDMLHGPTSPCPWLRVARKPFFVELTEYKNRNEDFTVAWLVEDPGSAVGLINDEFAIVVPQDWTPDNAIYASDFVPQDEIDQRLIEISNENGVRKYLDAQTGEFVYLGGPKE